MALELAYRLPARDEKERQEKAPRETSKSATRLTLFGDIVTLGSPVSSNLSNTQTDYRELENRRRLKGKKRKRAIKEETASRSKQSTTRSRPGFEGTDKRSCKRYEQVSNNDLSSLERARSHFSACSPLRRNDALSFRLGIHPASRAILARHTKGVTRAELTRERSPITSEPASPRDGPLGISSRKFSIVMRIVADLPPVKAAKKTPRRGRPPSRPPVWAEVSRTQATRLL